ncbi:hypothetical protein DFA_01094 [Cavenderia fasciculata]|uniref:Transmembrane protein n=1 Tax=Cavenderia fasciculata TaxID=261658 RepID=F4PQV4_CACFS|nr:uncharacterized protein DFA_01094 [Cavenderia fasciculata]EGG21219.1 hypothetical protein DFA_01094 [Cavenderia fasciculata]|eukprot:XP_004359069.1 hypothetical protein DFA_01094 [Cavenderia fasciculata]
MSDNNNNTTTEVLSEEDLQFKYNKKQEQDCQVCHAVSGTIIGGAGLYSLLIRNRHPEGRASLSFVGFTCLGFGAYWIIEPKLPSYLLLKSRLLLGAEPPHPYEKRGVERRLSLIF